MNENLTELMRLIRNIIRVGVIAEVDNTTWRCRVNTRDITTDWLPWLTSRSGRARTWWRPTVGEQVLILSIGGEITTGFVLPAIYSDENPPPSQSDDAITALFPDGARFEYEPETGCLSITGIKQVAIESAERISLKTKALAIEAGTTEIKGTVKQTGGKLSSNGIVLDSHVHVGVKSGGDKSGGPK